MKALLIDPKTCTVSTVQIDNDWRAIRELLCCRSLTCMCYALHSVHNYRWYYVHTPIHSERIMADGGFSIRKHTSIIGKAVVTCVRYNNVFTSGHRSEDVDMTPEEFAAHITWYSPFEMEVRKWHCVRHLLKTQTHESTTN